jgi:glycosyltransferase involved in cell wall biosynthesis
VGPDQRGEQQDLEELSRSLAINNRVTFSGVLYGRRLQEALAAADVFALLSRWEGLPVALLEALSCGTPAIVSSQVERLLSIAAAGAGWVTTPDKCANLLRDLSRIDEHEWRKKSKAALLLSKEYDWDVVAAQYEAAYEHALRNV